MKTWNYLLLTAVLLLTACSAKEKEPEIIKYTVTIEQPEGGTITVKQGNTVIENGTEIIKGTSLTVTATPDEFYTLESVNVSSPFELTQDTTITAVFEPMVMYTVTIEQPEGGTITVKQGNTVIENGTKVLKGTSLTVTATPDEFYTLQSVNVSSPFELTQDTTITAVFEPMVMYSITIEPSDKGTISVLYKGNLINSGDQLPENSEISIIALGNESHVFSSVNTGSHFTLTDDTHITVNFDAIDKDEKYKIGSYNIRYFNNGDGGGKFWNNRKNHVFDIIKKYQYDVCGILESTNTQAADFLTTLPEYTYIGYGRDNGKEYGDGGSGEQTGLIYKTNRFNELQKGRFFLSNTPTIASKLSGSTFNRMVAWVKLEDKTTQKVFFVFSTHFHHETNQTGINVREQQAQIAIEQILEITNGYPILFVGDFNCKPTEPAYTVLSQQWKDAFEHTPTTRQGGYLNGIDTYTGLYSTTKPDPMRIDFIFINDKINVKSYMAIDEKRGHSTYPSDHLPILIECTINGNDLLLNEPSKK